MSEDTVAVFISDLHCGSPMGLMPPKQWQLRGANVSPNKLQRLTWRVFTKHTKAIGAIRDDRRLIGVLNGDMVEGDHHQNKQVITTYIQEQEAIAIETIDRGVLSNMGFDADSGDMLYMVRGTNSHVGESEERIARDLGAAPYIPDSNEETADGKYCHPALRLNINGVWIWVTHKIANVGKGANRGNALRNQARNFYFDALRQGIPPPDYLIGSHFHQRLHSPYAYGDHVVNAFVLPPYKGKDDYTFGISPFGLGDLGLLYIIIGADGNHSWSWLHEEVEQIKEIKL
jgi:hypothetical protein